MDRLTEPVGRFAHKDFVCLRQNDTLQEALERIRSHGIQGRIIYFYVVDETGRLVGVLPTRRMLTFPLDKKLSEIMVARVVAIPETATVMDACEMFVIHKHLAFPVVNKDRQMVGIVEVGLLTDEFTARTDESEDDPPRRDDLFETIGVRLSQLRDASPFKAFRVRFPWLLATIMSGTAGALLAGYYETTLAKSLVLAFFLTMVLGLSESVSAQTMTVSIQALHGQKLSFKWFIKAFRREMVTALLLGIACGLLVGGIVSLWRGPGLPALVIGGSITLSLFTACLLGLCIPSLLHACKLDPKIASGPVTLAVADIATLLFYFNMGRLLLGG